MSDQNIQQGFARVGLNTDGLPEQVSPGWLTYALNAINSSYNGNSVSYQNEEGNVFCFICPEGYKTIGIENITELSQVWYWLTNPATGFSLIGYVNNNNCTFIPIVDDSIAGSDLMNFNILHPIHKVEVKTTNCSTQLYWTDKFNERRYIDLQNLPWKTGTTNVVDTNKMAVQPQFIVPDIHCEQVAIGGTLIEGDYQFTIQYANIRSEGLTSFYAVTNPVRIFLDNKISLNYNEQTAKSIQLAINNLDTTGLYQYFNLAVVKSINQVISVDLVGTFPIQGPTWNHVYSGSEQSNTNIQLQLSDILTQFDYYDLAGTLTQVDNVIVWADLVKEDDIAYQKIFNQVKVGWQTSQVPTGQRIGYVEGTVCADYEGYFRDEVYPLEGCFILANGKQTTRCHIPGRVATAFDLSAVAFSQDIAAIELGVCPPGPLPRWKVYNTGSVTGVLPPNTDPCTGITPFEYGQMSYWESTELYPNNSNIWGTLANQPIRHHKFPDSVVTHIHDNNPFAIGTDAYLRYQHNIYPIGFYVDINSLYTAIQNSSDLTQAEKIQIAGFKIMRGDRVGNNSIVAKGIVYNCGRDTKLDSSGNTIHDYYYPNYPFNDVNPDQFISSRPVGNKSGANTQNWLNDFQQSRFTFHSPDTHFNQASGIAESYLKLETAEYGSCKSHFVPVLDNAGEKIITPMAMEIAIVGGLLASIGANVDYQSGTATTFTVSPTTNFSNFFPSFNNMLEIIEKLTPWYNYGWQYNGVGFYGNYKAIPNDNGNKIRFNNFGGYIYSGINSTFGDNISINNTNRESSVYLSTNTVLPYTHQQAGLSIPADTSRQSASSVGVCGTSAPFFEAVSSYYTSIKRYLPGQYGEIFTYQAVDTGYNGKFIPNSTGSFDAALVYGGDCFINRFGLKIKHPFFLKSTVNKEDGYDIDYNQDGPSNTSTGNVGYPIWYYSTTNQTFVIDPTTSGQITNLSNLFTTPGGLFLTFLSIGLIPLIECIAIIGGLIIDGFFSTAGLKITNPECYDGNRLNEHGQAYLYAYGIIYYFCESQVNVDMRQAYNIKEGDFYPNVGTDIPDMWLQETNVPIAFDNTYTYNKTYSKENKETSFTLLRPDWAPDQPCYTNFNNRAIWSDQSSLEETKNNYLVYRPANTHDFPKEFGQLVALDTTQNREVIVRYQNHYQIHNALSSIDTTSLTAHLGTGTLFSTQPLDGPISDTGEMGTQNKCFISTEQGYVWVDAIRGEIILLRGHSAEDLGGPKYMNSKWFTTNLPFQILKTFPTIDTDNNFNGVGLHATYDVFYKRLIITKIDYSITNPNLQWDGTNFYIIDGTKTVTSTIMVPGLMKCCPDGYRDAENECQKIEFPSIPYIQCPPTTETVTTTVPNTVMVTPGDPTYFCDQSWTMSFSFISNSWVSWHSYIPNFYIPYVDYFQAGWNDGNFTNIWDHNSTFSTFNTFREVTFPYILEYPFAFKQLDQILDNIQDYCTALKYSSFTQSTEPNEVIYFNKMTVSTPQQCTGELLLIPKDNSSMRQYRQYPIYNPTSTSVLVTKDNSFYNVNMLWDHVIDQGQPIWLDTCGTTMGLKVLNDLNLDYSARSFRKYQISAKECTVRLTLDNNFQYKLISRFILNQTNNNYI